MEGTREDIDDRKISSVARASPKTSGLAFFIPAPPAVPVVLRVTEDEQGVKTMSSLDMVAYINSTREPGKAVLTHYHFMAKVPTVVEAAHEFLGTAFYTNGTGAKVEQRVYNFPRREAMLMAMSYSYKLQATVYDAWQEAEAKVAATVFGAPTNYLDALKQLVASVEVPPFTLRRPLWHRHGSTSLIRLRRLIHTRFDRL